MFILSMKLSAQRLHKGIILQRPTSLPASFQPLNIGKNVISTVAVANYYRLFISPIHTRSLNLLKAKNLAGLNFWNLSIWVHTIKFFAFR